MNIVVKPVKELTAVEYAACYKANYGEDGYMQDTLSTCRHSPSRKPGMVVLLWDGPPDKHTSLLGWCLLTPVSIYGDLAVTKYAATKSKYTAQFWVKRQYRKQGHGKTLMAEVKKLDDNPHVFPHDKVSGEFFGSYKVQVMKAEKCLLRRKPIRA